MGSPNAKVTLIEYGSLVCHHCANFNNSVLPTIKARYVNTGKVAYVFRAYPTQPADLAYGLHVLARCAGPTGYHDLIDGFFRQQAQIFAAARSADGAVGLVTEIAAKSGGVSADKVQICLRSDTLFNEINQQVDSGDRLGVQGTPTFFIKTARGQIRLEVEPTVDNLSAALDQALADVTKPSTTQVKAKPRRPQSQTKTQKAAPR